jgi:putative endonuclease
MGNTVLYTGITNNLRERIDKHRNRTGSKFTSRYNITKLVYYEDFIRIQDAITAEKRIKSGSREKKVKLVESINPQWKDLYEQVLD